MEMFPSKCFLFSLSLFTHGVNGAMKIHGTRNMIKNESSSIVDILNPSNDKDTGLIGQRQLQAIGQKTPKGTPSPFLDFAFQAFSGLHSIADPINWKFLVGDNNSNSGIPDIYVIKMQGVNSTEVHVLDSNTNYKAFSLQTRASWPKTTGVWGDFGLADFNKDGKLDLYAIKRQGVGATEVHILNGASSFQRFIFQTRTALPRTGSEWSFFVGDYNGDGTADLYCINRNGVVTTEISVLDGKASFSSFLLQNKSTALHKTGMDFDLSLGDFNGDGKPDIYAIKRQGASSSTEIHVLDGASNFGRFLLQSKTALPSTNLSWSFVVADFDADKKPDIFGFNMKNGVPGQNTDINVVKWNTTTLYWSDSAIWTGLSLPTADDDVLIPAGKNVMIDTACVVRGLEVVGSVSAADNIGVSLSADWIMVNTGKFVVGTENNPYRQSFKINLKGTNASLSVPHLNITGQNSFFIVTGKGAVLDMHGIDRDKVTWTKLDKTLLPGKNTITTETPVNWQVGDKIAIASSDFDQYQAEEFTITNVSADSKTITLNKSAVYMHYGELQSYSNGNRTWVLDERAEVGLLTRNIKVEGPSNSDQTKYGGHIIIKDGGFARLEGVELTKMGQKSIIGRYPFHWHRLGDGSGQYIKSCSIHHTFNRAVTIHGTSNVVVESNIIFDHIGHGYFFEDGNEMGCVLKNNLGFITRSMTKEEATIPTDVGHVSTFWITNPNNTFIGNTAAGSDRAGFWFALPKTPTGLSASETDIKPINIPLTRFDDNVGHSNNFSNLVFAGSPNVLTQALEGGIYSPRNKDGSVFMPKISNFVAYKCSDLSIWLTSSTFELENTVSADNSKATFFAYRHVMSNSLIVGNSANTGTPVTALEIKEGRSLPGTASMIGHTLYDGPTGIVNIHFAGFNGRHKAIQDNGASFKSTVHFARGITFGPGIPETNKIDFSPASFRGYMWSTGLIDDDGSITGKPGSTIMPIIGREGRKYATYDKGFNAAIQTTEKPEWSARINEGSRIGLLLMKPGWASGSAEVIQVTRCGGGLGCSTVTDVGTYYWYYQNPAFMNQNFTYYFTFPKLPAFAFLGLQFLNPGDKLRVVVLNVPTTTVVAASRKVNNMQELEASQQTSHFVDGSSLYVMLVGNGKANPAPKPSDPRFTSAAGCNIRFYPNLPNDGRVNVLSDFNTGVDSRASLAAINSDFKGVFTGLNNTVNYWDVISRANGMDGYTDLHFRPEKSQDWSFAQALKIGTILTGDRSNQSYKYQVYIHDVDQGYFSLGTFESGEVGISLGAVPISNRDKVDDIVIRVVISKFADLNQIGAYQRVNLDYLVLA